MSNADHDKLIDRIEKMLRKTTENGATEAEAEAAIAHAHRLMKKHNIEMEEILAQGGGEEPTINDILDECIQNASKFETFEQSLCWVVSKVCEIRHYQSKRRTFTKNGRYATKTAVHFYGLRTDVLAAKMLYTELKIVVRALARQNNGGKWNQRCWHFCNGFAAGLLQQVRELERKAQEEQRRRAQGNPAAGTLIVLKDKLMDEHGVAIGLRTGRAKRGAQNITEDYMRGNAAGREYDLNVDRSTKVNQGSQGKIS